MRYKLVLDTLETEAKKNPNPVIRDLTFGITFSAKDRDEAFKIATKVMEEEPYFDWHIEEVDDRKRVS